MSGSFDARLLLGNEAELICYMEETVNAIIVDWREEEEEIVQSVDRALSPDSLSCYWRGDEDLVLRYQETERSVGLTFSMRDRYICLRAINEILKGHYELRLFEPSYLSDTHRLLIKPATWWAALDSVHPKRSAEVFRKIDDRLDFP